LLTKIKEPGVTDRPVNIPIIQKMMRNLRPSQKASHLLHHLVPRGQPRLQFPHSLLLLLPIALQQVPLQVLSLHRLSVRQHLRRHLPQHLPQHLPRHLPRHQGLPRLQAILTHRLPLQRSKLLAAKHLTKPQLDLLQLMPPLVQ